MNCLETLKNIAKDKNKKTENLILLVIILVILLISINYIFSNENENSTSLSSNIMDTSENEQNTENNQINSTLTDDTLEKKLEETLSKINGISEVSVVLSYSKNSKQNVVYNTTEEESENGKTTQKEVAYNEESGKKTAIVESVEMPVVEGAIVVAKGANNVDIKSRISSAISAVTNLPVYKIQVFEKGE
jgi:stage III sporulation protein AG